MLVEDLEIGDTVKISKAGIKYLTDNRIPIFLYDLKITNKKYFPDTEMLKIGLNNFLDVNFNKAEQLTNLDCDEHFITLIKLKDD